MFFNNKNKWSGQVILGMAVILFACNKDPGMLPNNFNPQTVGTSALSYSGVLLIGAPEIPWTGESGILLFAVARNNSENDWRGHPEAAAYAINADGTRGELIAQGKGVLTTFVDRENLVPTDERQRIPAKGERESLTFIPIDFKVHPLVYVYWRFVDESNNTYSFKQIIEKPSPQKLLTLPEARKFLVK